MKKILIPILLTLIIVAISVSVTATQASSVIVDDTVNYATPTVDGILDDAYLNSLQVKINPPKYAGVETPVQATVYALYDDNYVYVFYQVVNDFTLLSADDDYIQDHPHPTHNDAVELRIGDDLEEHLPPYTGSNAAHHCFIMDAYGKRFSNYEDSLWKSIDLMKGASKITSDTSYNVEMAIPVVNPFHEGDIIQFNFQVDDCQDAEAQKTGYIGLGDNYMALTDFVIGPKETTLVKSGKCGDNVEYVLHKNGVLTISGTGDMKNYAPSESPWYSYKDSVKSVIIENGITSIGACAFSDCVNLTNVEIPESVISIGRFAFLDCTSLSNLTLYDSVITIANYSFMGCTNLTIQGYSGSYAETYANQNEIPFVAISDNIAEGTISETINWVIENNGTLIVSGTGDIPNFTKTARAGWYTNRALITSIVVEDGITGIGDYTFYNLANAKTITLADSVYHLGQFFLRETGITEITLNTAKEVEPYAFGTTPNLKTIIFSEDVKNFKGNIFSNGEYSYTIKAPTDSYVDRYVKLYNEKYNKSLVTLTFETTGNAKYPVQHFSFAGDNVFFVIYQKAADNWAIEVTGSGTMKNFPYISKKYEGQLTPMYDIAEYTDNERIIKSIKVYDGVSTIGNYSFYKCNKATSLTLPDGITSIGAGAFWACAKLENIKLPETVTRISRNAFNGCANLTKINIPAAVEEIGQNIFVKCNTDIIQIETENPFALEYLKNTYPEINVPSIYEQVQVRVVGTENYALNGAEKSSSDSIVNVTAINTDGTLGTTFTLKLSDCGLDAYENNTDALIGLDVELIKKNSEFISNATVLGNLRRVEVTVSDDTTEVSIDGTSYSNLKKLEYGTNTVTTVNPFTEFSDLKYPHMALALDHEGDGVVDAIAVDYLKLAKVVKIENVKATALKEAYTKYYISEDVTANVGFSYIASNMIADGKALAKGDVFVYAQINGVTYVEEIIVPISARATKITGGKNAEITLADVGAVSYVDGANGDTYLKNSGEPIVFNVAELLDKDSKPLDYYIYNNHVIAAVTPVVIPVYTPALLLYVKEPTDPVYNPETKKIEVFYPAVLLINGEEVSVNLNKTNAIDNKAATDSYVRKYILGSDNVYHNIHVEYTVDEDTGLYSLYTVSTYQNDARLIKYCAETSAAEAVDGVAYYSYLFLDFETMKNGSQVVDTTLSIYNGATKAYAGYFYGWDATNKKYVKVTTANGAVKIATLTHVDTARSIVYLDGAVFNVDGMTVDFGEGVKLDDSVKIWSTAGNNVYTYKIFTVEELRDLYELTQDNDITLEAAVGTYVDDDGKLCIAWILVDNYYWLVSGDTETLTQTSDITDRLK